MFGLRVLDYGAVIIWYKKEKLKMLSQPKPRMDSLSVANFFPGNLLLPYFKTNLRPVVLIA